MFAYEKETNSLKEVVKKIKDNKYINIAIIVGAEGGFDKKEAEQISSMSNADSVSLGQRILRAETASMYLTSILSYEIEQ
jgi:16S rRNA (uracil1498-N3)-methyltransferase